MSVQKRPRRRTRLPREARREQILEAATRAFVRTGYHGTHVDDVIREAGVARGTFYLHFESKHAVFAALVERMLAVFMASNPPGDEPEFLDRRTCAAALRRHYAALLGTVRRHRDLCRLLLEEAAGIDRDFADSIARHREAWHGRVRDRMKAMQDAGVARADVDLEVTAWAVVGMSEMLIRRYVLGTAAPDVGRLADAMTALDLRGIQARP